MFEILGHLPYSYRKEFAPSLFQQPGRQLSVKTFVAFCKMEANCFRSIQFFNVVAIYTGYHMTRSFSMTSIILQENMPGTCTYKKYLLKHFVQYLKKAKLHKNT